MPATFIVVRNPMTDHDKIDTCENLFVTNIYEPMQNKLAIEVALGAVSEIGEEFYVGSKNLGFGRRISYSNDSDRFRIFFDSYISYFVLNERYDTGMTGEYLGYRIREYRHSTFIDFCKKETSGLALHDENIVRHFVLVTQDHIVNVLTTSSPEIKSIN